MIAQNANTFISTWSWRSWDSGMRSTTWKKFFLSEMTWLFWISIYCVLWSVSYFTMVVFCSIEPCLKFACFAFFFPKCLILLILIDSLYKCVGTTLKGIPYWHLRFFVYWHMHLEFFSQINCFPLHAISPTLYPGPFNALQRCLCFEVVKLLLLNVWKNNLFISWKR